MTMPLAIIFYEKLLPGSQLVNRLQDLGYRVLTVSSPEQLREVASQERPIVLVVDFSSKVKELRDAIAALKARDETKHIPILAFYSPNNTDATEALKSGIANLVANEAGILDQLPRLLDQVLAIE
jgi:CheY-like chemotaxis protein